MDRIEKRNMKRFDLKLYTKLSWRRKDKEKETIELITSNICAGGAFFKTQKPLSVGTDVKINIMLSLERLKNVGLKRSYILVSGSVTRTDYQGMAICFDKNYKISPYKITDI